MNSGRNNSPAIDAIAAEIEGDMRQRGLRPGDKYLTASEASELFSVSPMKVHRAMRSLAGRELLVRQRSRGTFVGPKFRNSNHTHPNLDVVHLVMDMDYHVTQGFTSDSLVDEFSKSVPDAVVEVHHIQDKAALRHVGRLIERIGETRREGLVLIRCSREVQQLASDSGLPAIVFGQVYPGIRLNCVKHDQEAVGRFLADFALHQGARGVVLLTHARWRHGDHEMIDSLTQVLGAAGVKLEDLKIRSLPPDRAAVEEVVNSLLQDDEPPNVFLCRSDFYARIVNDMLNQRIEDKSEIERSNTGNNELAARVISGGHSPDAAMQPYARTISVHSLQEEIELVTRTLDEAVRMTIDEPSTVVIPVKYLEAHIDTLRRST